MTAAAYSGGVWYLAHGSDLRAIGDHSKLIDELHGCGQSIECRQPRALVALASYLSDQAVEHGSPLPVVACRGSAHGLELCGVTAGEQRWRLQTGRSMLADSAAEKGAGPMEEGPELALWSERVRALWREAIKGLDLKPRLSSGTTALQLLPVSWLRASRKLASSEPWQEVRSAYYGGRVQIFRKHVGEAYEHDLNTAYGAVLGGYFGYLPDAKLYPNRKPWTDQPAWCDATIEVQGDVAPLPRRCEEKPWRILWPNCDRWRGWYPLAELEHPSVKIIEVHKWHSGRYNHVLTPAVRGVLAHMDKGPFVRAVVKQLVVSLAGKLAQKPVRWAVWTAPEGVPPPPTWHHFTCTEGYGLDVYPVTPRLHTPSYLPMVAASVTSTVRMEVRAELERAGAAAIYTDTDSVHVDCPRYRPLRSGSAPGQWALKESGPANYIARRHYSIGGKRVNC